MKGLLAVVLFVGGALGCASVKPYEKELLLDPLMSDEAGQRLAPSMLYERERLGGAAQAGSGNACPTCGG